MKLNKELTECVGLWLAEGDKVCNNEITLSNNCLSLIKHFHKNLISLFKKYNFNIRIYIYSPNGERIKIPFKNCKINRYIDRRATKPYYIWRLASVELNKKWKDIVEKVKDNKNFYPNLIRGFFAGEGNIKTGSHNNRTIRIAQGKPLKLIESILHYFNINYRYSQRERSYVITGKDNWDKCAKIKIAELHPIKKLKFWNVYKSFKEEHYKKNYLKNKIFDELKKPYTSSQLALKFKRSQARIYDILSDLKKTGKINNFRVKSKDIWVRKDQNIIILSKIKYKYLKCLDNSNKTTKEISKKFNVCWKSSFNRLKELEKLGLVKRRKDKMWEIINTRKKVVII